MRHIFFFLSPCLGFVACSCSSLFTEAPAPDPEPIWNKYGYWTKISNAPPTYIPTSLSATQSLGEVAGTWHVDQRDGKRLFAPVGDWLLTGYAEVITTKNLGDPSLFASDRNTDDRHDAFDDCPSSKAKSRDTDRECRQPGNDATSRDDTCSERAEEAEAG